MPKLSETLTHPRNLEICQSCGCKQALSCWREHDESDWPTHTVVILCDHCSNKIIEKHPRLYERVGFWAPIPGAMQICQDCIFMSKLNCSHPNLEPVRGGRTDRRVGTTIDYPRPTMIYIDRRRPRTQRRVGKNLIQYSGPPTACAEKKTAMSDMELIEL